MHDRTAMISSGGTKSAQPVEQSVTCAAESVQSAEQSVTCAAESAQSAERSGICVTAMTVLAAAGLGPRPSPGGQISLSLSPGRAVAIGCRVC